MKWTLLFGATVSALASGTALAQDCAAAPVAIVGANPFDTTGSTVNFAMPAGGGCAAAHTIYASKFFTFTAAVSGSHTFSLCGGSTYDTRIAILNTCDPAAGVVGCNDDSCGLQSLAVANLTAGSTYKIVVGGYGTANFGAGTLTVSEPAGGGGGGGCDTATAVTVGDNPFTATPTGTLISMSGYCTMQFTPEIYNVNFFNFTPPADGNYSFSTCNLVTWDSKIAVMNTCDPAGGVLACNDDGAGCASFSSYIPSVALVGGTTYKIAIGGYSASTAVGAGTLAIGANNFSCKGATALVEGSNAVSTAGATGIVDLTGQCDPGDFGDDAMYNTVAYTFTPTASDVYKLSTCNIAPWDTRLAVMNTCNPADGVLACNDDGPASCANFTSTIEFVPLEAGVTYYVMVGGFSAADSGSGSLEISRFVPCSLPTATGAEAELCGEDLNGGCNNAAGGFPTEPIAVGDTVAGEFWADGGTRDTDWYLLTLTEPTEVSLTINSSLNCFAAFVDTACGGILGTVTAGTCPGTTSFCFAPGSYYVVCLPSVFNGYPCGSVIGNAYTIQVSGVPCDAAAPPNDRCATATVAIEGANPFDNTFADTEIAAPSCGFGGAPFTKDVWFSFTASQTGGYNLETCSGPTPFDTGIEIYDACPDQGGVLLACNDDGANCAAFASSLNTSLTAGVTYLIRVGGWNGATGATNLVISSGAATCGDPSTGDCCVANTTPFCNDATCCTQICAADAFCCDNTWDQVCANAAIGGCTVCGGSTPPNDECAGAVTLAAGATPFDTTGATGATAACTKFGNPNVYNDIWYVYTATGNASVTMSLCGSLFDTKIAVFEGSCTGALVACNDDALSGCVGTLQSEINFATTCGTRYYVSVGSFSAAVRGSGTITVTQTGTCAPPCPADLTGDGTVGGADLTVLLSAWGAAGGPSDLNNDGLVGGADLTILLSAWGACP